MFNRELRKEAIERLERLQKEYSDKSKSIEKAAINLYNCRKDSLLIINQAEVYINSLANTPKEFSRDMEEIKVNKKEFNYAVELETDASKTEKFAGGSAAGAAAVGAGVAAFGPTAAMAIATTFGTASTGTAIASLSGAAATNAALAWIGGGALAAGGGGMAAGNAFLALAGPIGWGIGAVGIGIGMFAMGKKNKEIARKATNEAFKVKETINKMEKGRLNINQLLKLNQKMNNGILISLKSMTLSGIEDYRNFSDEQKRELGSLVNNLKSLSVLINKRLDGESMDEIEYERIEI
ncbi:hypothetical protein [Intestinibacter bartlettii]|uniref:hypothetical protein n=1 Tax=Intestinibacter bartlettii TaxID=261299 RepID=UPI00319DB1F1